MHTISLPRCFPSRNFVEWAKLIIIERVSSHYFSVNVTITGMDKISITVFTCIKLVPIIETSTSYASLTLSATIVTRSMSILTDKQVVNGTSILTFKVLAHSNLVYVAYLARLVALGKATQGVRTVSYA